MPTNSVTPPGAPGIPPRWTSSAKSGVGTAAGRGSRAWFTISHGILNEIYASRLDTACIRDFGFIVTAKDYFSEEKRDCDHTIRSVVVFSESTCRRRRLARQGVAAGLAQTPLLSRSRAPHQSFNRG
jgi:hypothetical protein